MSKTKERNSESAVAAALDRLIEEAQQNEAPSFTDLVRAAGLNPGRDFVGASLVDLDFRDEDLRGFNFSGADLRGADFRRANVTGVRLEGANLLGAIGLERPGNGGRILLVQDDMNVRTLLGMVLTDAGYHVELADSVDTALSLLSMYHYDLIIAENFFLNDDKSQLDTSLFTEAKNKEVKLLVLTGYAVQIPQEFSENKVLRKPSKPNEILDSIQKILESNRGD